MSLFKNMVIGQYVPGTSFIHKLDPRSKLLFIFIFVIIIFLANNAVTYGLLTLLTVTGIVFSQISTRYIVKGLRPIIFLILLTSVLHLWMTKEGDILLQWQFITIYEGGVKQAIFIGLRLILLISTTSLLTLTTSPIDLTDGLERLFKPFEKIGLPAHELALMMSIALRFIPTLMEETEKIMKAQMARGANFESGGLMKRAKNMIPLLVPLFVSSFKRAEELAMAMEARGYRGGKGRTRLKQLQFTWRDCVLGAITVMLVVLLLLLRSGS